MSDTALAIMLIGAYLPPRTLVECVYASLSKKIQAFFYFHSLRFGISFAYTYL